MFKRFFESRAKDLLDLYDATAGVDHRGEKGMLRELVLRRLLSSVLPPQFGIGSGIVIDKWNRQSRQADLIIYDKRRLPPIFMEESRGLFPFDAVMRVIEVKSVLDAKALSGAFESFSLLDPDNPNGLKMATKGKLEDGCSIYPVTSIFAYKSVIGDLAEARKKIEPATVKGFRFLCVVDRGVAIGDGIANLVEGATREHNIRTYVALLLQCLEDEAATRKEFSTVEWLLD